MWQEFKESGTLHLVLLAILTATLGGLLIVLLVDPDVLLGPLERLELTEPDVLRENRGQFYIDLVVFWTVGATLLGLDHRCRRVRGRSLWAVAFGDTGSRRATRSLRMTALFSTVVLVPVLVGIYLGSRPLGLEWIIAEDGPLEYGNALGFAIAAILLGLSAWRYLRRRGSTVIAGILALLAGGSAFVALEEISWGQRIFGLETPAGLERVNTQSELNLHNVATDTFEPTYLVLGAGVYAVAWLACLVRGTGATLPGRLAPYRTLLPDPSLVFLAAVPVLFAIHITLNELVESVATVAVVLYAIDVARRSDPDRGVAPDPSEPVRPESGESTPG